MPNLKLTYFDIDGGRAEPARLALHLGGIAFDDRRLSFADVNKTRGEYPFGRVPVLEVDGKVLSQSNSINRYVGRLAGLYPEDPWQAALCDEIMDAVEDVAQKVVATFGIEDPEALKAARAALVDGPLRFYLERVSACLDQRGGEYFADGRLTIADLKVFVWLRQLRAGRLDHVPTDLAEQVAPLLAAHRQRVESHPGIAAYYQARQRN